MSGGIVRWGLVAAAASAAVVIGVILLTGNDAGPRLSPSSSLAQTPQSTTPVTEPGTLAITFVSEPGHTWDVYSVRSDGTRLTRLTAGPGSEQHARWSPDGTRIVYASSGSNRSRIFVMKGDGSGKVALGEGSNPSWSPDGEQILYDGTDGLTVVSADGSGRRAVGVGAPYWPTFATWAQNGKIVFVRVRAPGGGWMYGGERPSFGGDLYAVNPDGSGLERLTKGARMILPSVSPDGSTITAYARKTDSLIAMPFRGAGSAVTLLARASEYFPTGGNPVIVSRWSSDGKKLVLGSDYGGGDLYVVNADGSGLARIPGVTGAIDPDWRPTSEAGAQLTPGQTPGMGPGTTMGRLAYGLNGDIYMADGDGTHAVRIANGVPPGEPATRGSYWGEGHIWSPDGRYLAYRGSTGKGDSLHGTVFIRDPRGHLVTSFRGEGWDISWSPDSTRLASWVHWGRTIGIYGPDGVRQKLLTLPPGLMAPGDFDPVWSLDGGSLVVPHGVEIPLDGSAPRRLPADDPRSHWRFWYSPDGARVAYSDYDSLGLVVAAADGSQARVLVPDDVEDAVWSPTGDRIAFDAPTGEGMTNMGPATELRLVDVASGTVTKLTGAGAFDHVISFSPDGARILFSRTSTNDKASLWSISADGSDPHRLVTGTTWGDWQSPSQTR